MALELLILDCDGVILESMDIKTRAFHRLGMEFGEDAGRWLAEYHQRHGGVSRDKKFAWLYEDCLGRAITEEEKTTLNEKFIRFALEALCACPLVPGIDSVLQNWHDRVPVYVASGSAQEELEFILQEKELSRYFKGIYGSPPGKTELLRKILRETGVSPAATVMVGDSSADLYAAEAAGTAFYGRGEYFRSSGYPWHTDLTLLHAYLENLANEP